MHTVERIQTMTIGNPPAQSAIGSSIRHPDEQVNPVPRVSAPLHQQWLYFSRRFNETVLQIPRVQRVFVAMR